MHTTPRLGLQVPDPSDNVAAFPAADAQAMGVLDSAVTYSQGTLASLPAASLAGRRYYATDIGQELYDTGSSWILVGSATPIGALMQFGGAADPVDPDGATRRLICDGRAIGRSMYARLFTALSTTYGNGNGSTTFNIPDLRGRIPVGADSGGAHLPANHPALGASGGEESHTLSTGEMPSHGHSVVDPQHVHGYSGFIPVSLNAWSQTAVAAGSTQGGVPIWQGAFNTFSSSGAAATGISLGNTGGGGVHNNLQPYVAVNHIVKVL